MPAFNFENIKDMCGHHAVAYLTHLFVDNNRLAFRHVRHCNTHVHVDSTSDLKLLLAAYEFGLIHGKPLRSDLYKYSSGAVARTGQAWVTHPIASARFLFWGYSRTREGGGVVKPFVAMANMLRYPATRDFA